MIEVSDETIEKLHTVLARVENARGKVLKPAFGRALQAGKTEAKRKAVSPQFLRRRKRNHNKTHFLSLRRMQSVGLAFLSFGTFLSFPEKSETRKMQAEGEDFSMVDTYAVAGGRG